VTVVVNDQQIRAQVVEVPISITSSDGVLVGAVVGDATGFDWQAILAAKQSKTEKRVSALEQNAEFGASIAGVVTPNENLIINGTFRTNQRAYASGTALASLSYSFDRWRSSTASSSLTFTAAAQGQLLTINSGGSFLQVIEKANVPAGTHTISWAGNATGRIYNSGATAPAYAVSPVTVTLDGSAHVVAEFTAVGETKTLGQVKVEAGSVATAFVLPSAQNELAACQRYYFRWTGANGTPFANVSFWTTNQGWGTYTLPVPMRVIPSAITVSGTLVTLANGANNSTTVETPGTNTVTTLGVIATLTAGGSQGTSGTVRANTTGTTFIEVSVEL
jgi:hypothetical protein